MPQRRAWLRRMQLVWSLLWQRVPPSSAHPAQVRVGEVRLWVIHPVRVVRVFWAAHRLPVAKVIWVASLRPPQVALATWAARLCRVAAVLALAQVAQPLACRFRGWGECLSLPCVICNA